MWRVPPAGDLASLLGLRSVGFLDDEARDAVQRNVDRFGDLTPHSTCAGVDYPRLVNGEADFVFFWRTLPWDHAPGALLVAEAGGVALRPDRSDYAPTTAPVGLLAAADWATGSAVLAGLGIERSWWRTQR